MEHSKVDEMVQDGPTWVYIAGRGHSGSTMLDAMLGNVPQIESVGELVSGMGRYDEACSCGETFRDCPYWTTVRKLFDRENRSWDDAVQISKGQAHIKALPRTLVSRRSSPWVQQLIDDTQRIGTAITQAAVDSRSLSGAPRYVVDSSKEITRALFFVRFFPEARVIHLMRHPASILQSDYYRLKNGTGFKFLRKRYYPKRVFGPVLFVSVITWIVGNILSDVTRLFARDRFLRVQYESIIADPSAEIDRIESFLPTPLGPIRERLSAGEPFDVGHNIGGNHMRMAGTFSFDPRKSGRRGLPVRFALMSWLMTWPLLIAYGYRGRLFPRLRVRDNDDR